MRNVCIAPSSLTFSAGCSGWLRASTYLLLETEPPLPVEYEAGCLAEPVWTFWRIVNIIFMGNECRCLLSFSLYSITLLSKSSRGPCFSRNKFLKFHENPSCQIRVDSDIRTRLTYFVGAFCDDTRAS